VWVVVVYRFLCGRGERGLGGRGVGFRVLFCVWVGFVVGFVGGVFLGVLCGGWGGGGVGH